MIRKIIAALAAAGTLVMVAQADAVPTLERPGFEHLRELDLKADLYFLSSDALQGRMSLQAGDEAGAQWVASEFAKAGLEPIAHDEAGHPSYLQTVPLIEYRGDTGASFVKLKRGDQTFQWRRPDMIGGFHDDVEITAPLVFAGYGITAPGVSYDDYRGVDARGKIVVVFEHEPQENDPHSRFNGTGNTRYATNRVKALNAQAHGALAVLVIAEPNRKHPSNLERQNRIGGSVTRANPLPAQVIVDDELNIPTATMSDAAAAELLRNAGTSPKDLQAAIDKDLSNHSMALADSSVTFHVENKSRISGVTHRRCGGVGACLCGQPRKTEALHSVRGICRGRARTARLVLHGCASVAPARHHARNDQLRHDRPR
jgi:PA domain